MGSGSRRCNCSAIIGSPASQGRSTVYFERRRPAPNFIGGARQYHPGHVRPLLRSADRRSKYRFWITDPFFLGPRVFYFPQYFVCISSTHARSPGTRNFSRRKPEPRLIQHSAHHPTSPPGPLTTASAAHHDDHRRAVFSKVAAPSVAEPKRDDRSGVKQSSALPTWFGQTVLAIPLRVGSRSILCFCSHLRRDY